MFFIETETTNFINKLPQNISNEDNKKKMMGKKKVPYLTVLIQIENDNWVEFFSQKI